MPTHTHIAMIILKEDFKGMVYYIHSSDMLNVLFLMLMWFWTIIRIIIFNVMILFIPKFYI